MKNEKAFTLAEVLITLGIIGVVAAMTMPTLIQNYQEKATVTKLKKFYSTVSQSYKLAEIEYGAASEWGIAGRDAGNTDQEAETYNATNAIFVRDRIIKNLKVVKTCDNALDQKTCGLADKIYRHDGGISDISGKGGVTASALLADGTTIVAAANGGKTGADNRGPGALSNCSANIHIDTNGLKGPNTFGEDVFMFYLTDTGLIPTGTPSEATWKFPEGCVGSGYACTAWVIYNENMDYLHCDDLSWTGKTKCK